MSTVYLREPLAEQIECDPNGAKIEVLRILSKLAEHCQDAGDETRLGMAFNLLAGVKFKEYE